MNNLSLIARVYVCVCTSALSAAFPAARTKRIRQSLPLEGNHNKLDEKIIERGRITPLVASTDVAYLITICSNAWCAFASERDDRMSDEEKREEEKKRKKWDRGREGEKKEEGINRTVPSQRQWVINGIVLWISPRACEFAFPRQRRRDPKQSLCACVLACVRACKGDGDAAKTSLACIAPYRPARMHFHPAPMWIFFSNTMYSKRIR